MSMTDKAACFTSNKDDWCTPDIVLAKIRQVLPIGLDPCGNKNSRVMATTTYMLPHIDGLDQVWSKDCAKDRLIFVNPPYSRNYKNMHEWLTRCRAAGRMRTVIALLPSRTSNRWWHEMGATAICFWKGRLKFIGGKYTAPFPSALVLWTPSNLVIQQFRQTFKEHQVVLL